jgi:DNA-directed RNA polymerase subunit RPC12/RpoP
MQKTKGSTYTCAACGGTFEKGWTDEEAEAEMKQLYGDLPKDDRVIICSSCNDKLRAYLRTKRFN